MSSLPRGSQPRKGLDKIQDQIAEKAIEIDQVRNKLVPRDEVFARIEHALSRHQRGNSDLQGFRLPIDRDDPRHRGSLGDQPSWSDLIAIFGRDELAERLTNAVDLGESGLPVGKRTALIQKLEAEKHELEIAEEKEILRLQAQGFTIIRRADADPATVLSVA